MNQFSNQTPSTLDSLAVGLRDHATAADFAPIDLAAVHARGTRRRRTRQAGLAGLAVAAVAAVSIGVPALSGSDAPRAVDAAGAPTAPAAPDRLSVYAHGADLVTRDGVVTLPAPVYAFVVTASGFVVIDEAGTVSAVVDGVVTPLASVTIDDATRLVTDGRWVAWSDDTGRGRDILLTAWDDATGSVGEITVVGDPRSVAEEDGGPLALDDGTLYAAEARGVVAFDLPLGDGEGTVMRAPADERVDLLDVRGDVALTSDDGLRVGPIGGTPVPVPGAELSSFGELSPTAEFVSTDGEKLVVLRPDGTDVTPTMPAGYGGFGTGYGWVDDDTLAVVAGVGPSDQPTDAALLTCEVPSGECTVVVENAGAFDDGFQLPVGISLD